MSSLVTIWGTVCNTTASQLGFSFNCQGPSSVCQTIFGKFSPVKCTTTSNQLSCTNSQACTGTTSFLDDFRIEYDTNSRIAQISDNFKVRGESYSSVAPFSLDLGAFAAPLNRRDEEEFDLAERQSTIPQQASQLFKNLFSAKTPVNNARYLTDSLAKVFQKPTPQNLAKYETVFLGGADEGIPVMTTDLSGCQYSIAFKDTIRKMDNYILGRLIPKRLVGTTDSTWLLALTASHAASSSALAQFLPIIEQLINRQTPCAGPTTEPTSTKTTKTTSTKTTKSTSTSSTTTTSKSTTTTSSSTTSSTKSTTSTSTSTFTPPPQPTFAPTIPDSYDECFVDPTDPSLEFYPLRTLGGIPIKNNQGQARLLRDSEVNQEDPLATVLQKFRFQAVPGAPKGIYDIVQKDGATTWYLAATKQGGVQFVARSSNGQQYITEGAVSYVTTIWSVDCEGLLSGGIVGGDPIKLAYAYADSTLWVYDYNPMTPRAKMDLVLYDVRTDQLLEQLDIQKRWPLFPNFSDEDHCRDPLKTVREKPNAPPKSDNGCGPAWAHRIADGDFAECCKGHDYCFDDCHSTFKGCNLVLTQCMKDVCQRKGGIKYLGCSMKEHAFTMLIWGTTSRLAFRSAGERRCDCVCDPPKIEWVPALEEGPVSSAIGKSEFCCNGGCVDGTFIGNPGECQTWFDTCDDVPSRPQCSIKQVFYLLQQGYSNGVATGRGQCWISGCPWIKGNHVWQCRNCPDGYFSVDGGACGGRNACVRCPNSKDTLIKGANGYECVSSCDGSSSGN